MSTTMVARLSGIPPQGHSFEATECSHRKRRMSGVVGEKSYFGPTLTTMYMGISAAFTGEDSAVLCMAAHDTVYLVDYAIREIKLDKVNDPDYDRIAQHAREMIRRYEKNNFIKFIGAGLPVTLASAAPTVCSRLWLDLDIVPIVIDDDRFISESSFWEAKRVDEQADSMARKCLMHFGPSLVPLLHVGFRGHVQSDAAFKAHLFTLDNCKQTCGEATWNSTMHFAHELRDKKIKIAFFSSTPQGGGVALMRHSLVRFSRLAGVDLRWYVPKPRPGVFRITKNIHNILQGVSPPDEWVSDKDKDSIVNWILENAHPYWLSEGGPLRPPEEGGAHLVVIDDPQMPALIPFIKKITPDRPVIYRSHIQVRADLCDTPGTPQEDVWKYLWNNIQQADMLISHPIQGFVPKNVPRSMVAYMPATTDWLDGLNKPLSRWITGYYGNIYNIQCHSQKMTELAWPARKYIVQIARFDPSKGVPDVIDAYAEFRRLCDEDGTTEVPQLCICGNGSIDDPDASMVYDEAMQKLEMEYPNLIDDCSIMRLDPNDQLLNTLLANAHVALQLSTREGFEVKVSEALHAGRPVIATRAGGIPLQVKDGINGFLVEPGDWKAVAQHLRTLFSDDNLHQQMSRDARTGVSDEIGTVGNALAWYYLGTKWAEVGVTPGLRSDEQWVNDMAREGARQPYAKEENRLPREFTHKERKEVVS